MLKIGQGGCSTEIPQLTGRTPAPTRRTRPVNSTTRNSTPSGPRRLSAGAGHRTAPYDRPMPRKTTKSAARGADPKSRRTRERILDAAAHVLSRKGYAGTRLGNIAEQAQLQAPAIYYYWPSREEL